MREGVANQRYLRSVCSVLLHTMWCTVLLGGGTGRRYGQTDSEGKEKEALVATVG